MATSPPGPAQKLVELLESLPAEDRKQITAWLLGLARGRSTLSLGPPVTATLVTEPSGLPPRLGHTLPAGEESQLVTIRLPTERRLVIRQPGLVEALTLMFEGLWEKAMSVPGLDPLPGVEGASAQRLLLLELAGGAKDEQIARALGMSVRTVRRRVADLMDELGADSRFQAGVEAVRRGWI